MINFNNLKEKTMKNEREEERIRNLKDSKFYNINEFKQEKGIKNTKFTKYCKFKITQKGIRYKIYVNFQKEQKEKKEIAEFIKEGMEKNSSLMIVLINVGIEYGLGTKIEINKRRNKIKLFIS